MNVNYDMTLDELRKEVKISQRAYNVCRRMGITRVSQLMDINPVQLNNARNCGLLTRSEILRLKSMFVNSLVRLEDNEEFRQIVDLSMQKLQLRHDDVYDLLGDVNTVLKTLSYPVSNILSSSLEYSTAHNAGRSMEDIYFMLRKLVVELQQNLFITEDVAVLLRQRLHEIDSIRDEEKQQRIESFRIEGCARVPVDFRELEENVKMPDLSDITPYARGALEIQWQDKFAGLNTRVRNRFRLYESLPKAMAFMYAGVNPGTVPGLSNASVNDFVVISREFHKYLNDIVYSLSLPTSRSEHINQNLSETYVRSQWPWLEEDEVRWLARLDVEGKQAPALYLIRKYAQHSEIPAVKIHREYFGLMDSGDPMSNVEVSKRNDLSMERIRQIKNSALILPESLLKLWKCEEQLINDYILTVDSPSVEIWKKANYGMLTAEQILFTLGSVSEDWQLSRWDKGNIAVLIDKKLLRGVNIGKLIMDIHIIRSYQRKQPVRVDVYQEVLKNITTKELPGGLNRLSEVITEYLDTFPEVTVVGDCVIEMSVNKLDRMRAFEVLLRDAGEPLGIEEIAERYNARWPQDKIDNISKIRSYLIRNDNINCIGHTGTYALSEWDWIYTGTFTACMLEILMSSSKPMHISELREAVEKKMGRPTTVERLMGLCLADKLNRFVVFDNRFVAPASRYASPSGTLEL